MKENPFFLCSPLGDTPFPSVGEKKKDTNGTHQKDTPFPSVARLKIDTPNHTGTNMYKTPHKGRRKEQCS